MNTVFVLAVRISAFICAGIAVGTHYHNVFYGVCTALVIRALYPEIKT